jgi:hypothetical protein
MQPEGERFTPLCSREARGRSAKKRQRGEEAFSAICFPGWKKTRRKPDGLATKSLGEMPSGPAVAAL